MTKKCQKHTFSPAIREKESARAMKNGSLFRLPFFIKYFGGQSRNRTTDTRIFRHADFQREKLVF